jgi:hypothetical protein
MKVLIGVDKKGVIVSGTSLSCANETLGDDLKYLAAQDIAIYVVEDPITIGAIFKQEATNGS